MIKHFESLDRQRGRLLTLVGSVLTLTCAALVVMSWEEEGLGFEGFEHRWPTLVGLFGLVLIFVLYVQNKHRQMLIMERRMREMAVREARLSARFTELSFLFDISTQLQLRLDLQGMLDLAVQRLIPCLDAHQASIMLHDPATDCLEVKASAGIDSALVANAKIKPGEGISGHVFASGETLILTDDVMEKRFSGDVKRGRRIASGLCVPMRFRGTPIGVVSVSRTSGENFADLHARMLETFAEHCAATVVKTNHHHELLKQVKAAA
jgi:transcriptional regulator with GAF, ATPase, and Fis domain